MAAPISVDVIGDTQLIAAFQQLEKDVVERLVVLTNTATTAAHSIAVLLSPVRTGRLRRGNKMRAIGGSRYYIANELYNDVEYALFVCFGTSKMRARDFMTPAIQYGRKVFEEGLPSVIRVA